MPESKRYATLPLEMRATDVALLEAGDPFFADHAPDPYKAYVRMRFAHSLPVVAGPESVSGQVFGLHPAVVSRSFLSAMHQQTNLGHRLKVMGAARDRIVGCLVQLAYPEEPEGGWTIPESIETAPAIQAVAVMWKQAEGVEQLLGQYMSGKVPWSVSMEMNFYHDDTGIYDPATREVFDRREIPAKYQPYLFEDERSRLMVRKNSGSKLVPVLGGRSGTVWFSGIGYTDRPAEPTAAIDGINAMRGPDGMLAAKLSEPKIVPGVPVGWSGGGGMWGRGEVVDVHYQGRFSRHRMDFEALPEDPLLDIRLPDGTLIFRRSSTVSEKLPKT